MKHISSILIQNFQSHSRSELAFDPGLNVIVGPSDNGKSAVLRALRWALYNEPRGSEFVRSGARECTVTVTMSDGAVIERYIQLTKSGTPARNRYTVTMPGGEPQVFEGFGVDPPKEVLTAHAMAKVKLDTDKDVVLGFGNQLEGPFLMAETGSFRARAIGRLLGVHVVDAATRSSQKDLRAARTNAERLGGEVQRYDDALIPYNDIPQLEEALERAEKLLARVAASGARLQTLQAVQEAWGRTNRDLDINMAVLIRLGDVEAASRAVERAAERSGMARLLDGILLSLTQVRMTTANCEEQLEHLSKVGDAEAGVHRAEGAAALLKTLSAVSAQVRQTEADLARAEAVKEALKGLPRLESVAQAATDHQTRLTTLRQAHVEIRRRDEDLATYTRMAGRLTGVARAGDILDSIGLRRQRLEQLQGARATLAAAEESLHKGAIVEQENAAALAAGIREYGTILRQLGTCPTCLQPVAPEVVDSIIGELVGGPASVHGH